MSDKPADKKAEKSAEKDDLNTLNELDREAHEYVKVGCNRGGHGGENRGREIDRGTTGCRDSANLECVQA